MGIHHDIYSGSVICCINVRSTNLSSANWWGCSMKTVFSKDMVAHIWAQQSQYEGRTATGNFYFKDATLYSYGNHFIVGKFEEFKGKSCILMSTRSYSVTTASQQAITRQAIRNTPLPVFYVPCPEEFGVKNKTIWDREIKALLEKAAVARTKRDSLMEEAGALATMANSYATFFELPWTVAIPELSEEFCTNIRKGNKERALQERIRKETRERAEAHIKATCVDEWLLGVRDSIPYGYRPEDALLRVRGDEVQTSHGATVSTSQALRILPVIRKCRDTQTGFIANGHTEHIGQFAVREIKPNGDMIVGCHSIKWAEIYKVAIVLGSSNN